MVSVIIPVHNCEKWIARCIDSVLSNQETDLEIILILNNSQDSSEEICKSYGERNNNVHVYVADRGGVSHARNLGLKYASGEYISFIDADDYISPDYFKTLLQVTQITKADIAFCDFEWGNGDQYAFAIQDPLNSSIAQETFFYEVYIKERQSHIVVWGKLYRKTLLDGVSFDETLRVAEDKAYVARAAAKAERLVFVHKKMYYYFLHSESTCGNGHKDINVWYDSVRSLKKDVQWLHEEGKNLYEGFARCCLLRTSDYYYKWSSRLDDRSEMTKELRHLIKECEKGIIRDKRLPIKIKARTLIEHYFPNQVQGLYQIKQRLKKQQ